MLLGGRRKGGPSDRRPLFASASMKSMLQQEGGRCKSRVAEAPKRQAVGSPGAGVFNNPNLEYVPGLESECEDDDMRQL